MARPSPRGPRALLLCGRPLRAPEGVGWAYAQRMALGRDERVIWRGPGGVAWIAPLGTPFPKPDALISEPWTPLDVSLDVPDTPPEDITGEP